MKAAINHFQLSEILDGIIIGDVLKVLYGVPSRSVRCIVTSPPYYGLRDYGTALWLGGDPDCDHKKKNSHQSGKSHSHSADQPSRQGTKKPVGDICHCGAIRIDDQIGLEKTPEEYISKLVLIFRECRRILTDDGTLWLNIGDSYWGSGGNSGHNEETKNLGRATVKYGATSGYNLWKKHHELKPKDLIGIPWMLAFALRADGWWLRSDIIWNKPNPMPESVTDRPTKAHEYIFLLTKSEKYYYDSYAIRQPLAENSISRLDQDIDNQAGSSRANGETRSDRPMKAVRKSGNLMRKDSSERGVPEGTGKNQAASVPWEGSTANKKTVWTVATKPFKSAHFATFPENLIVDCIRAGASEHGQCSICGKPWVRVVQKQNVGNDGDTNTKYDDNSAAGRLAKKRDAARQQQGQEFVDNTKTIGWQPSCECNGKFENEKYIPNMPLDQHPVSPDVVMDPFGGAGTTAMVAKKLFRNFILVELNEKYVKEIAVPRMQAVHGIFYTPKIIET